MPPSSESLVRRLAHNFGGRDGHGEDGRPFADLSAAQQLALLTRFPLQGQEAPALGVAPIDGPWLLVTTARIAYDDGSTSWVRPATDLGHVSRAPGQDASRKEQWRVLELDFRNGVTARIRVEPGKAYFGLWNALLLLARVNRPEPIVGG